MSNLIGDIFATMPKAPQGPSAAKALTSARRDRLPEFRQFPGVTFYTTLRSIRALPSTGPKATPGKFSLVLEHNVVRVERGTDSNGNSCDDATFENAKRLQGHGASIILQRFNAKILTTKTPSGQAVNWFMMKDIPGQDGVDINYDVEKNQYQYPDQTRLGALLRTWVEANSEETKALLADPESGATPEMLSELLQEKFRLYDAETRNAGPTQDEATNICLNQFFNMAALNPAVFEELYKCPVAGMGIRYDVSLPIAKKEKPEETYSRTTIGYSDAVVVAQAQAAAAL